MTVWSAQVWQFEEAIRRNGNDKGALAIAGFHGVDNSAELAAAIPSAERAVAAAHDALVAFDRKAGSTVKLAEVVEANVAAAQHRADEARRQADAANAAQAANARAEQAVKDAEADQVVAQAEQDKAEAVAKIEQVAAAKRAEAAAIRQKAADAAKAAADAMARAKAEEERAAAQEQDAATAEAIAKAPAPAPKRVWWVMYANTPRCVTATEADVPSPAEAVEKMDAKLDDRGAYVQVTTAAFDYAYYRTQDACEKAKDEEVKARADKSHALDQYR
jgi:hypothetical protein